MIGPRHVKTFILGITRFKYAAMPEMRPAIRPLRDEVGVRVRVRVRVTIRVGVRVRVRVRVWEWRPTSSADHAKNSVNVLTCLSVKRIR